MIKVLTLMERAVPDRKKHIASIMHSLQIVRRKLLQPTPPATAVATSKRLTAAQWPIFAYVTRRGGATIKELAAELQVSSSAITQQVDLLVEKGFLVRDSDAADRRATIVRLSSGQKQRLGWIESNALAHSTLLFEEFTATELAEYDRLHKKLLAALAQDDL